MPVLFWVYTTAAVHVHVRPCPHPQSSLCISCYLKTPDFYKNGILYKDKRFCSTLYRSSAPFPWTDNVADSNWALWNHQPLGSKLCSSHPSSHQSVSCRPSVPGQCDWEGGTLSKVVDSALKVGHRLHQQKTLLTDVCVTSFLQRQSTMCRLFVTCGNDLQICSLTL